MRRVQRSTNLFTELAAFGGAGRDDEMPLSPASLLPRLPSHRPTYGDLPSFCCRLRLRCSRLPAQIHCPLKMLEMSLGSWQTHPICLFVSVWLSVCVYVYVPVYMFVCMCMYVCACVFMCMCVCVYVCMCLRDCVCVCACVCVCVWVCVCVSVFVIVWLSFGLQAYALMWCMQVFL